MPNHRSEFSEFLYPRTKVVIGTRGQKWKQNQFNKKGKESWRDGSAVKQIPLFMGTFW